MARPGRPPIGDRAMTSTERSRRRRDRLRANKPATKYATKPPGEDAARWQAEIAALKAEIARLKAAPAQQPPLRGDDSAEIARLTAELAQAKRRKPRSAERKQPAAEIERAKEDQTTIAILKDRIAELQAIIERAAPMTRRQYIAVLAGLHDDAVLDPKRRANAFVIMTGLEKALVSKEGETRVHAWEQERARRKTAADLAAAREARREANSARSKAAWARRKARTPPR